MKRKFLGRAAFALLAVCVGLAACSKGTTTTTQGPPTAYAVLRLNATNGAPDTTFAGGRGIAITDIDPASLDFALAVAIEPAPSNKILAAGSSGPAGQGVIALVRYNTDGTLDQTFGTGGVVKTTVPSLASSATAIAVQPVDSKILVAALTFNAATSTTGIALLRYNTNGSLDTTGFGAPNGFVTATIGPGLATDTCALALQGDGKIVVAGATQSGSVVLYRYTPAGLLDPAFGTGGSTTTSLGTGGAAVSPAIALQSTGKIIVVSGTNDQVVLRYNTDGTLDNTFGTAGIVVTDAGGTDFANAVAVQFTPANPLTDDKIVVAGHVNVNFSTDASDISLVRYTKDGALDTTFGPNHDGKVTTDLGGRFDNALSLVLQPPQLPAEPLILVSGNTGSAGFSQMAVLRYQPDGLPDASFGVSGVVIVNLAGPSNIASGNAVTLQPVGTGVGIVVAGYD